MAEHVEHKLVSGTAGSRQTIPQGAGRPVYDNDEVIPLAKLEQLLKADLEQYLASLSSRLRYVFVHRVGYGCERQTLQAIGNCLPGGGVTRERVRQIQVRVMRRWRESMRVPPHILWPNLKKNLSLLGEPLFPDLKAQFIEELKFYEFLEMSCDLKDDQLVEIVWPSVSAEVLNKFWAGHRSPADLAAVIAYLEGHLGICREAVENAIFSFLQKNITVEAGRVFPLKLPKAVGVANTLLDFPKGMDWRALHKAVNAKGTTRAKMPGVRIDGGVPVAVDNGWVYQCGLGRYRHISFLKLPAGVVETTLKEVAEAVERAQAEGRRALNLSADFYRSKPQTLSYFEVRHIVRTFGKKFGIFFNGKSGADTLSQDPKFDLVGQQQVLLKMFAEAQAPLDKKFIASRIRSQSSGHASFYIGELINQGAVVRVGKEVYAHIDNAFKGVDKAAVVKAAAELVQDEPRIIEGERLQCHINAKLGLAHNKVFYFSLLRTNARQMGYDWHYAQNLVCRDPIGFESLRDLCRSLLRQEPRREIWVQKIEERCLIDQGRLRQVLGSVAAEIFQTQWADGVDG